MEQINLILCNKDCIHQKEGYCALNEIQYPSLEGKANGCAYFISREKEPGSHFMA